MKDKLFILGKIVGILIFLLVLSLMGLASGNPMMILGYAGFFVLVMLVIFLFVRRNQRHFEIVKSGNSVLTRIIGIVMLLLAIAIPPLAISNMQLFELGLAKIGLMTMFIAAGITIALIAIGVLGVWLINRAGSILLTKILGHLVIIAAAAVPALLVIPHDHTTTGIGMVYYLAVMVAVIAWWGFSLILNKE